MTAKTLIYQPAIGEIEVLAVRFGNSPIQTAKTLIYQLAIRAPGF
jgi:hypothetical protein